MSSIIDTFEPLSWRIYPPEFIISEKLEALISREGFSSRSEDIYDIALLAPRCSDAKKIKLAIEFTFKHRKTKLTWPLLTQIQTLSMGNLQDSWPSVNLRTKKTFDEVWKDFEREIKKNRFGIEKVERQKVQLVFPKSLLYCLAF